MTRTVEVPRERWASYLQMLSQMAAGTAVRLEVMHREREPELARFMPLHLLHFEERGSERGDLLLTVGTDEDEYTHHIRDATRLHAGFDDCGALDYLLVEEVNGGKTLIYFEQPFVLEVGPAADHAASP